ncbi:MAG: hypothetical protein QXM75_04080, partial [Candidatus Diapherotrites archaeon]
EVHICKGAIMSPTDWIISSVVFVFLIVSLFVSVPWLMSINMPTITETELQDILSKVTHSVDVKAIFLKSDCNGELYDCNGYYPIVLKLDMNADYNYLASRPFDTYSNKLFVVVPPEELHSIYLLSRKPIEPNYDEKSELNVTSMSDGTIVVSTPYLEANIGSNLTMINYLDSNIADVTLSYPDMNMSVLKSSKWLAIVGDSDKNFGLLFFYNVPEFWVDTPPAVQVGFLSSAANWRVGDSIGVLSSDFWWDYNEDDDYWWHYRIPITINSLNCARTNEIVQTNIDFNKVLNDLNVIGEVDSNSFRLIEYSGFYPVDYDKNTSEIDPVPFHVAYSESAKTATVKWQIPGIMPANSVKKYYLYFDLLPYRKDQPIYTTLNYSRPECDLLISTGNAQSTKVATQVAIANRLFVFNPSTLKVSVKNLEEREWLSTQLRYRIPIAFNAGRYSREDVNVSIDVNFSYEFASVGCKNCDLNIESVYLVEVASLGSGSVLDSLKKGTEWDLSYEKESGLSKLWFLVKGRTKEYGNRYYFLYYDSNQ